MDKSVRMQIVTTPVSHYSSPGTNTNTNGIMQSDDCYSLLELQNQINLRALSVMLVVEFINWRRFCFELVLPSPSAVIQDLGIFLDSDMSVKFHVPKMVSTLFAALQQLQSNRHSVSRSVVTSLVLSRLDYGRMTLAIIHQHLFRKLQSVMNTDAQQTHSSSRFNSQLSCSCVLESALTYLADELCCPAASQAQCRLGSASSAKRL